MFPTVAADAVPWVTADEMGEVDRVMIEDLGIELIQMMENAGRGLAVVAMAIAHPSTVTVLAGTGGNGGGALVAARHLANRGVDVSVTVTASDRLRPVPEHQYRILERMNVRLSDDPVDAEFVIDGVIGYSLQGAPSGRAAELIEWTAGRRVLSLDIPSGVDATTGDRPGPSVEAVATATLAAPKTGMRSHPAVGDLYVLDISVPPGVVGWSPDRSPGPIVRLLEA